MFLPPRLNVYPIRGKPCLNGFGQEPSVNKSLLNSCSAVGSSNYSRISWQTSAVTFDRRKYLGPTPDHDTLWKFDAGFCASWLGNSLGLPPNFWSLVRTKAHFPTIQFWFFLVPVSRFFHCLESVSLSAFHYCAVFQRFRNLFECTSFSRFWSSSNTLVAVLLAPRWLASKTFVLKSLLHLFNWG